MERRGGNGYVFYKKIGMSLLAAAVAAALAACSSLPIESALKEFGFAQKEETSSSEAASPSSEPAPSSGESAPASSSGSGSIKKEPSLQKDNGQSEPSHPDDQNGEAVLSLFWAEDGNLG